jgi:hypothetical protein
MSLISNNSEYYVYSSHKTTTQSLCQTLKTVHTHYLSNIPSSKAEFLNRVRMYKKKNNRKLKIITVLRDPNDRIISSFFQSNSTDQTQFCHIDPKETTVYKSSVEELVDLVHLHIQGDAYTKESIDEIMHIFDFTYQNLTIRKEHRYAHYENDLVEIFVLDFDALTDPKNTSYLGGVLNVNNVIIAKKNVTADKPCSKKYTSVKLVIGDKYRSYLHSKFTKMVNLKKEISSNITQTPTYDMIEYYHQHVCNSNSDVISKFSVEHRKFKANYKHAYSSSVGVPRPLSLSVYRLPDNHIDRLVGMFKKKKLITQRMGSVETSFLLRYKYNITKPLYAKDSPPYPLGCKMKMNAGMYYTQKNSVSTMDWWCRHAIELIKTSVWTSTRSLEYCYTHGLLLAALNNVRGEYYVWSDLMKLLPFMANQRVLFVGAASDSVQSAFKKNPESTLLPDSCNLHCVDVPQTTTGCKLPDVPMSVTVDRIIEKVSQTCPKFDTAILACGAYAPPITNKLRNRFPNTNILYFGSMANRVFSIKCRAFMLGVNPCKELAPPNANKIDGGRYW